MGCATGKGKCSRLDLFFARQVNWYELDVSRRVEEQEWAA